MPLISPPFPSGFLAIIVSILDTGRSKNTAVEFGLRNTWRRDDSTLLIDHILVSRYVAVANLEVGPRMGSDHCPVLADVLIGNGE